MESALNKPMTTRFPASAVLMELACRMKAMSLNLLMESAPRSGNQEASRLDSLQNFPFQWTPRKYRGSVVCVWIRLPRHKWPNSWANIEDDVVLLERNLYGHPFAGLLWDGQFEEVPFFEDNEAAIKLIFEGRSPTNEACV